MATRPHRTTGPDTASSHDSREEDLQAFQELLRQTIRIEVVRTLRDYGHLGDVSIEGDAYASTPDRPGWDSIGETVAVYDGSSSQHSVPQIPLELLRRFYTDDAQAVALDPLLDVESLNPPTRRQPPVYLDDRGRPLPSTIAEVAESSYSTAGAAEILGVNPSRIRQRLGDGSLYGFKYAGAWKIPSWQIEGGATLPNLATIVREFGPDSSPVGVTRWFTSLGNDLLTPAGPEDAFASRLLSPREWLAEGRDPAPVVAQAKRL